MIIEESRNGIILKGVECLSLPLTLDCGEAFRWAEQEDGSWSGAAYGKYLNIKEENGNFILKDTSLEDFENVWRNYFDLDRDYAAICAKLKEDELVRETIDEYYGIRILNQEPWEALVSFVISQQNNIKRIKGIIKRLCDTYGEKICDGWHAFPTSKTLSKLSVEDFEAIGLGYRAKYVKKLADDVESGAIDLAAIKAMDLDDAKKTLLSIYGVGEKVANCALLFGFQFIRCFPVDVWMKRVLQYYPDGLPECFSGYEGIAQQYLFHWARNNLQAVK
jgi:N-glycosylase/DNA lyase